MAIRIREIPLTSGGGGGGTVTGAENGTNITENPGVVRLGGTLIEDTEIDLDGYQLSVIDSGGNGLIVTEGSNVLLSYKSGASVEAGGLRSGSGKSTDIFKHLLAGVQQIRLGLLSGIVYLMQVVDFFSVGLQDIADYSLGKRQYPFSYITPIFRVPVSGKLPLQSGNFPIINNYMVTDAVNPSVTFSVKGFLNVVTPGAGTVLYAINLAYTDENGTFTDIVFGSMNFTGAPINSKFPDITINAKVGTGITVAYQSGLAGAGEQTNCYAALTYLF